MDFAQMCCARQTLASNALYSASLFDVLNLNLIVKVNLWLDGLSKIIPTSELCSMEEPSTYSFHLGSSSAMLTSYSLGLWLNSATKSANTCSLMAVLGLNSRSYCFSSINHLSRSPEVFGFYKICLSV